MNRRKFLKTAGIATGGIVLACGGLGTAATITPPIDLIEKQIKRDPNMKKVLVTYSSKAGSTSEVAAAIAEVLNKNGASVTVAPIKKVDDISNYQAVVVGSLIRMGLWVGEAKKFVETNKAVLEKIPTAYFTTCATLKEDNEKTRAEVAGYVEPVHQILTPVESALFGGKMDTSKLNFFDRKITEMMAKGENPNGDYRNWDEINAWAEKLVPQML